MAHFKKKTVLLVVFLIVLISLTLRYPLVEHERHNDTFVNRMLANSILENDYAVWTFHPLSYIGYYPASYPSGTSFLLAEISEMSGVNLSVAILTLSMSCGMLFALSAFCLSRILLRRIDLVLLATVLATLAPRFIDTSYWSSSARAPFVAMAVLAVFIAAGTGSYRGRTFAAMLATVVIGCFALHHMTVLFVLFVVAYILSTSIVRATHQFGSKIPLMKRRGWLAGLTVTLLGMTAFVGAGVYLGNYGAVLTRTYASTSLFSFEPVYLSALLNMAASYTNQIGFVLPIAAFGLPFYFSRIRLTTASLFPVLLVISFVPLLPSAEYITMVLSPFVAVIGAALFGVALKRGRGRRVVFGGLALLVCASLVLPALSSQRWNEVQETSGDLVASDMQLFTDAAYLRSFGDRASAISNADVVSTRLAGASGVLFLKSGTPSALSGDVTPESLEGNISANSQEFPYNLYRWFEFEDEDTVSSYVVLLMVQGNRFSAGVDDRWTLERDYYETHSKLLVVIDNNWEMDYVWATEILSAKLPSELRAAQWGDGTETYPLQSYSIYVSERITLYIAEVANEYEY